MDRVEDVWDRKWSGLLRAYCRAVDSIIRGHQAIQVMVRVPTNGPSQRWEEGAPPVEMETHHELIIIIIQCLWAAVGSPSKREDNVGAQSGPVECSCHSCACLEDPRRPGRIGYLASCCSIEGSIGIDLGR